MRVTNQLLVNDLLAGLNANRSELAKINKQLSTQRTVNQPSDEPGAYAASREMEARMRRNELYQTNAEGGIEQAQVASESVDQMLEQLRDLKRVTVQGANNTLDDKAMEILADQVAGIRSSLVQLANKNYNGRFLFGGTATQDKPFSESGTNVTFNGNSEVLETAISETTTIETSTSGAELFDVYGTDNTFDILERIETALRNNDPASVNAELTNVDDAVSAMASKGSEIGNNINRMEYAFYEYQATSLSLSSAVSRLVDTDYAEAMSRFQTLDIAYQASLNASSRLLSMSLVNYL